MKFNFKKMSKKARFYCATLLVAVASLLAVSLMWRQPIELTWMLLLAAAAMLSIRFSRRDLLLFTLVAIAGPLAESAGIYSGAWTYLAGATPYFPPWLPMLWGIAGIFVIRLREAIDDVFS